MVPSHRVARPLTGVLMTLLLIWGGIAFFLFRDWQEKGDQEVHREVHVLETTFRAGIEQYRLMADLMFDTIVRRPEVLKIMAAGAIPDVDGKSLWRGRLFRELAKDYARLRNLGAREFQIISPDGRSFLRLHQPDKAGDTLVATRPLVRLALAERRAVSGFEIGGAISGFRYIFPLLNEEVLIGAGEIGIGFRSMRQTLEKIAPTSEFAILLDRRAASGSMWEERQRLYGTSGISDTLLVEDPFLELPDSAPRSPTQHALDALAAKLPEVPSRLAEGGSFGLSTRHDDQDWILAFVPIRDVGRQKVGYLVGYTPAPGMARLRQGFWWALGYFSSAFFMLVFLAWRLNTAHRRIAAEREQLLVITETMGDALYLSDEEGVLKYVNPAFCALTGFTPNNSLGRRAHTLIHGGGQDQPEMECAILFAIRAGRRYQGAETFYKAMGETLPVDVVSAPVKRDGAIAGSVTVFRDVSRWREAERMQIEARRAVEENARLKSEFLASMSHEIRTPMNGVIGMTALLLDTPLDAGQRDMAETIRESADGLMVVLNRVLDFSRIEAGKLDIDSMPFAPRDLAESALRAYRPEAGKKGLLLEVILAATVPAILTGDPARIRQVMANLIDNAIKFTESGRIEVRLGWKDDDCLQIEVEDTGVGIAEDVIGRLFQQFVQADGSVTRRFGGMGLGLAISRGLVELMGGTITAQSQPGRGAIFTVKIPSVVVELGGEKRTESRELQHDG